MVKSTTIISTDLQRIKQIRLRISFKIRQAGQWFIEIMSIFERSINKKL